MNIGFNKINAISTCIAEYIAVFVTNSNVSIDSTIQTIDRTEF
jgi:L-serine deaminase